MGNIESGIQAEGKMHEELGHRRESSSADFVHLGVERADALTVILDKGGPGGEV